jgi:hypothetical protein
MTNSSIVSGVRRGGPLALVGWLLVSAGCGSVISSEPDAQPSPNDASTCADARAHDAAIATDAAALVDAGPLVDGRLDHCLRATTAATRFVICGNPDSLTWTEADAFCADELGMRLARIDDEQAHVLVRELGWQVRTGGGNRALAVAIGATDIDESGVWRWLTGDPDVFWIGDQNGLPQNDLYNNWHESEPNNQSGDERYLAMWSAHDWQWNDISDRATSTFACSQPSGDVEVADHCYLLESPTHTYQICRQSAAVSYNWLGARQFCQDLGMDLAEVRSEDENELILQGIKAWGITTRWALGGSDAEVEGTWRWVGTGDIFWIGDASGSPEDGAYTNWASGEPNNTSGGQDYLYGVVDGAGPEGRWDDGGLAIIDGSGWICQQLD